MVFVKQVHARIDNVAVGKLSLNLTCLSKESVSVFGNQIRLSVQNLLPFTQCIPLTVNYLNTASLAPKKDYQTNRYQIRKYLPSVSNFTFTTKDDFIFSWSLNMIICPD